MIKTLHSLRKIVIFEGMTLILLMCIAVPLKRLGGYEVAVSIMGPIHGAAFLILVYTLVTSLAIKLISFGEAGRLLVGAFIPFGGVFNERWLKQKALA